MQNAQYEKNSNYEVIGPVDYETAKKYGDKSCSTSKLCYTQNIDTWNNYTQNGYNNVYIILQKGWENIPERHDDDESNSAYDTYGLSMIFVFVNGQGDLVYCNNRWNHNANYETGFSCDHAMSKEWISQLIGIRFDEVFKPNNKWKELLINIQKRLQNGEDPEYIFDNVWKNDDGWTEVEIRNKYNLINEKGELVYKGDNWFDYIGGFFEGFVKVRIQNKYNFINEQGELLWKGDNWFNHVTNFRNGVARVILDEKGYNFINTQGELLWKGDNWFDYIGGFVKGYTRVNIEGRGWNFINTNGELLWKKDNWFDYVYDFYEGFAEVKYKGVWCKLNTKGELYDEDGNRVNIGLQESKRRLIKLRENDIHKLVIKTLKEYLLK